MIYLSNEPYPQEISIPRSFGVIVPVRKKYLTEDDIATDLETDSDKKVLAASQGVILKAMIDGKANANDVYTKTEMDEALADKANVSDIPDVSQFITRSVNDLAYYYLKSETYTQQEVRDLIAAINQFHYEVYASISDVTNPQSNVLYLIGPTGTGSDRYEEYVYANGWVKIGDTSIDLSGYVTTQELNTALADYVTNSALATALAGKQDTINDLQTIRDGAAAGATAYQKPQNGIPANDLAQGVIPDVSQFITKSVNDLVNYYKKTETYNKTEVDNLIGAIQGFHYEIAASTSAVTNPQSNVLYLIGPTGTGSDKYEEYVYTTEWVKIGDTSIDLSGYVTTQALNTALAGYVTSGALETALAGKQDKIDANHKLDYSLVDNTPTVPVNYAGSPTPGGFATKAVAIPFGEVVNGSTDTNILAQVDNFPTELVDGVCAYVRNNRQASASGWTLNINGTGAKPVYASNAESTRSTTTFSASVTYLFIYNSTRVAGGCWDMYYGYNANDNTIGYNLRTNTMSLPTTSACYRYRLLFTSADGTHFVPANASSSTSATSTKTTTQTKIDPFGSIRYYSSTTAVSSGNRPSATNLWEQYLVTLGYSFNRTGAALTLTAWKPVYIKCTPQADGSAIIEAETPYVQDLPTTADGKIYIFLGVATSATQVEVVFHHPVYYHDGTGVRLWTGIGIDSTPTQNSKNLVTSGGIYDAIQNAGGGGSGEPPLLILYEDSANNKNYFLKSEVDAAKNSLFFRMNSELYHLYEPDSYSGLAIMVSNLFGVLVYDIRSVNSSDEPTSTILRMGVSAGQVTGILFEGKEYTYNSATERYEAPAS